MLPDCECDHGDGDCCNFLENDIALPTGMWWWVRSWV